MSDDKCLIKDTLKQANEKRKMFEVRSAPYERVMDITCRVQALRLEVEGLVEELEDV